MTYQDFLSRVQEQAGLSSAEESERVVRATLSALGESLSGGGVDQLPQELRNLLPAGLSGAGEAPGLAITGEDDTNNPQVIGETREESGGESTAESGQ